MLAEMMGVVVRVNTVPCELVNYAREFMRKVLMLMGQEKCSLLLLNQYRRQELAQKWVLNKSDEEPAEDYQVLGIVCSGIMLHKLDRPTPICLKFFLQT
jgi:hypothetical protein